MRDESARAATIDPLFDSSHDARLPRNRVSPPRGPKSFRVEKTTAGVRVVIYEWATDAVNVGGSNAVEYVVEWAEDVDMTTAAGVSAGEARATLLSPTIASMGSDARPDRPIVSFFADPKYIAGFFYVRGKGGDGQLSPVTPPQRVVGASVDGGLAPNDVEHFRASESGEQHGQTVMSVVSYAFRVPTGGGAIDRVQFMYQNYPNLNEFSEGESRRVTAGRGGTQTGELRFPIGRRIGGGTISISGTAVTGTSSNFLSLAAAAGGDQLEVFGVRARIASVASNTSMTLSSAWTGPAVSAVADWQTIAAVTIYAVAEGLNGARRDDPENSPSVTLDLDGDLSAPVSPDLTATPLGNAIRLVVTPAPGTQLTRALLYKIKGAGNTFDKATWQMIHPFAIDPQNPAPWFQFDDSDFLVYDREQGQVFGYAATVVNVRDQESDASDVAEAACKLDAPSDNSPTNPARDTPLNIFWNGMLYFNANATIDVTSVQQDVQMGGGVPPAGFYRWDHEEIAGATPAGFQNTTEVILPEPGIHTGANPLRYCAMKQRIDAWGNATAGNRRIKKGEYVTLQFKARTSGGHPNGSVLADISQQDNAGVHQGYAKLKRRLSDDSIDETQEYLGIAGSDIPTDYQLYWGTFHIDDSLTTDRIVVRIYLEESNSGVNVIISEVMLNHGDGMSLWTGQQVSKDITYPGPSGGAPTPPNRFKDQDGTAHGYLQME